MAEEEEAEEEGNRRHASGLPHCGGKVRREREERRGEERRGEERRGGWQVPGEGPLFFSSGHVILIIIK